MAKHLIINTPTDSILGTYPNEAIVFGKDGNVYICLDYTKCTDTEDDHLGYIINMYGK